jgi:hypothetical protein
MVAAAKGHEKAVKKLMRLGAVFWNDGYEEAKNSRSADTIRENEESEEDDSSDDDDSSPSPKN